MAKDHVLHPSTSALLIVDMINTLDFPGSEQLLRSALPVARAIARLKERAKAAHQAVIYVNDNFGQWRSDWREVFQRCAGEESKGRKLALLLQPEPDDYFVLKPKHSGFYGTSLEVLLQQLECERLVLTGVATDMCILFTAQDAYLREFETIVPADCVASCKAQDSTAALALMRRTFKIRTPKSSSVHFPGHEAAA